MSSKKCLCTLLTILLVYSTHLLGAEDQALKVQEAQRKVHEAEQEVKHASLAMKPEFQVFGRYSTFQVISAQNNLARANQDLAKAKNDLYQLEHAPHPGK